MLRNAGAAAAVTPTPPATGRLALLTAPELARRTAVLAGVAANEYLGYVSGTFDETYTVTSLAALQVQLALLNPTGQRIKILLQNGSAGAWNATATDKRLYWPMTNGTTKVTDYTGGANGMLYVTPDTGHDPQIDCFYMIQRCRGLHLHNITWCGFVSGADPATYQLSPILHFDTNSYVYGESQLPAKVRITSCRFGTLFASGKTSANYAEYASYAVKVNNAECVVIRNCQMFGIALAVEADSVRCLVFEDNQMRQIKATGVQMYQAGATPYHDSQFPDLLQWRSMRNNTMWDSWDGEQTITDDVGARPHRDMFAFQEAATPSVPYDSVRTCYYICEGNIGGDNCVLDRQYSNGGATYYYIGTYFFAHRGVAVNCYGIICFNLFGTGVSEGAALRHTSPGEVYVCQNSFVGPPVWSTHGVPIPTQILCDTTGGLTARANVSGQTPAATGGGTFSSTDIHLVDYDTSVTAGRNYTDLFTGSGFAADSGNVGNQVYPVSLAGTRTAAQVIADMQTQFTSRGTYGYQP